MSAEGTRIGDYKYCPRGKHMVLRSQFNGRANSCDGLQAWCKACSNAYCAQRSRANAAEGRAVAANWKSAIY